MAFNTTLLMRNCLVTENTDGIDLESTQGKILSSRFVKNKDDGIDYDGDAGVLVYGCEFTDNGDDGIEIRIARRTHAIILSCVFEGNGEDGIEIINSPTKDGIYNLLCVQNCLFRNNRRFGVGFVPHKIEEHTGEMSKTAVYAVGNTFEGAGEGNVSPNYVPVFNAPQTYPGKVKVTLERMSEKISQELVVQVPLLVGIYNLRPTTDGTMVKDAEGVTVFGNRIYVADDTSHSIFMLDRCTAAVVKAVSTDPFSGGSHKALGPEGLDVIPY
ncbi:right-handed parallel beta-helix repeat-containing protein, partial [bacterium]|nr:right-handed parallel beta-helix repeat-containing protein [bacterium]